jgi:hypothetical protein
VDYEEIALLIAGIMILTAIVFFSRKHLYAAWTKVAYIIASLAGLVWGFSGLNYCIRFMSHARPIFSCSRRSTCAPGL